MRFIIDDLPCGKESLVHIAWASVLVLIVVLAIRPICVFLMFGRAAVSRRIDAAVNLETPANPRRAPDPARNGRSRPAGRARSTAVR